MLGMPIAKLVFCFVIWLSDRYDNKCVSKSIETNSVEGNSLSLRRQKWNVNDTQQTCPFEAHVVPLRAKRLGPVRIAQCGPRYRCEMQGTCGPHPVCV